MRYYPRREKFLSDKPFLRNILDADFYKLNPDEWAKRFSKESFQIGFALEKKWGVNWIPFLAQPQAVAAHAQEVFNPWQEAYSERCLGLTVAMIQFGYELKSFENINLIMEDVMSYFVEEQFFNHRLLETSDGRQQVRSVLTGMMLSGAQARQLPDIQSSPSAPYIPPEIQNSSRRVNFN